MSDEDMTTTGVRMRAGARTRAAILLLGALLAGAGLAGCATDDTRQTCAKLSQNGDLDPGDMENGPAVADRIDSIARSAKNRSLKADLSVVADSLRRGADKLSDDESQKLVQSATAISATCSGEKG